MKKIIACQVFLIFSVFVVRVNAAAPMHLQALQGSAGALLTRISAPAMFTDIFNDLSIFNRAIFDPIDPNLAQDHQLFIDTGMVIKNTILMWPDPLKDLMEKYSLSLLLQRIRLAHLDQVVFQGSAARGNYALPEIPAAAQHVLNFLVGRIFKIVKQSGQADRAYGIASGLLVSLNQYGVPKNIAVGENPTFNGVMTCAHALKSDDSGKRCEFFFVLGPLINQDTGLPNDAAVVNNATLVDFLRQNPGSFQFQTYDMLDSLEQQMPERIKRNNSLTMTTPQHFEKEDILFAKIRSMNLGVSPVAINFVWNLTAPQNYINAAQVANAPYFAAGYPICQHYQIPPGANAILNEQKYAPLFVIRGISDQPANWPRIVDDKIHLNLPNAGGRSGGPIFVIRNEGGQDIIDFLGCITMLHDNIIPTTSGCYWQQ